MNFRIIIFPFIYIFYEIPRLQSLFFFVILIFPWIFIFIVFLLITDSTS